MPYAEFAEIIKAHLDEILGQVAQEALNHKLYVREVTLEQAKKPFRIPLEAVIEYLQVSNLDKFRSVFRESSEREYQVGFSVEGFQVAIQLTFQVLVALMARELPGPQNEANLERFQRRLENLKTLSNAVVFNTFIDHNTNPKTQRN